MELNYHYFNYKIIFLAKPEDKLNILTSYLFRNPFKIYNLNYSRSIKLLCENSSELKQFNRKVILQYVIVKEKIFIVYLK